MAGTVTGKNCEIWMVAHSGSWISGAGQPWTSTKNQSTWALSDFSLTFDRGIVESDLMGEKGPYTTKGSISVEGSMTAAKFATPGYSDLLYNMCHFDEDKYKYLGVSGTISTDTDATYLKWCLASCQVTGFDFSLGDADTVTEASIDFIMLNPQDLVFDTAVSGVKG